MSAVRFAMFAERAVAILDEARSVKALPSNEHGLSSHALRQRLEAKHAADADIATFEPLLYPPDELVN